MFLVCPHMALLLAFAETLSVSLIQVLHRSFGLCFATDVLGPAAGLFGVVFDSEFGYVTKSIKYR